MTENDRKQFSALWSLSTEAASGKKPSGEVISYAFSVLEDFPLSQIKAAIKQHSYVSVFAPKAADIIQILIGSGEGRALSAWLHAKAMLETWGSYETVWLGDPKSHYAINAMGGWVAFGAFTLDELPFRAKDFLRHYGEAERTQLDWDSPGVPGELLGHTALSNKMVADAPKVIVRRSLDRPRTEAREAIDRRGKESPYALPGPDISSEQAAANVDRIKALTDRFCREKLLAGELDETEAAS